MTGRIVHGIPEEEYPRELEGAFVPRSVFTVLLRGLTADAPFARMDGVRPDAWQKTKHSIHQAARRAGKRVAIAYDREKAVAYVRLALD